MNIRDLNYKKIGLVTLFVIIVIGLIILIVRLFFTTTEEPVVDQQQTVTISGNQLPVSSDGYVLVPNEDNRTPLEKARDAQISTTAQGGRTLVLPVNETRVVSPTPTRGGQDIAFYDPYDGYFYRLSADGENKTLLSDEKFFTVDSVSWSANNERAVIEYPDGSNILYDFTTGEKATLPKEVTDAKFSPLGDTLAFKLDTDTSEDNWLVITDEDGNNAQFIEPLGDNGDQVDVVFSPDEQVVALYAEPTGGSSSEVYLLGKSGENFKSISVDGLKFKGIYSPDGERMLYSVVTAGSGYLPELWVVDGRGSNTGNSKFDLKLNTWVDKCVFSDDSRIVYCAVPETLSEGAGLTPIEVLDSNDNIYRIDLDTGLRTVLAQPVDENGNAATLSVTSVWLDKTESTLFMWDGATGGVYKMKLK